MKCAISFEILFSISRIQLPPEWLQSIYDSPANLQSTAILNMESSNDCNPLSNNWMPFRPLKKKKIWRSFFFAIDAFRLCAFWLDIEVLMLIFEILFRLLGRTETWANHFWSIEPTYWALWFVFFIVIFKQFTINSQHPASTKIYRRNCITYSKPIYRFYNTMEIFFKICRYLSCQR